MIVRGVIGTIILLTFVIAAPLTAGDDELSPRQGIDRYESLVRSYPQSASHRNALGYYYLQAEDYQRAEACFLQALELDSEYATAHNNLGILHLRRGRPERAEKEFLQALKLRPSYCKAQYNLAVALFHQRRFGQAAKAYLKAGEMDSDYVEKRDSRKAIPEEAKQTLKQTGEDYESNRELKRLREWFALYY